MIAVVNKASGASRPYEITIFDGEATAIFTLASIIAFGHACKCPCLFIRETIDFSLSKARSSWNVLAGGGRVVSLYTRAPLRRAMALENVYH